MSKHPDRFIMCGDVEFDAVDRVAVPRNVGEEEVAGVVGGGETADAGVLVGIGETAGFVERGGVADAGEVALNVAHFGADGVLEERLIARRTDVLHELRGDHGDGVADVAQVGVETIACEGGAGTIAGVGMAGDLEWRKDQDLIALDCSGGDLSGRRSGGSFFRRSRSGRLLRPNGARENRERRDQGSGEGTMETFLHG